MAKLYAASEEPLPSAPSPDPGSLLQLCFSGRAMIKTQVVKADYVHAAIIADQMMSNASELRGLHGGRCIMKTSCVSQSRLAGDRSRRSGR
ncbi:aminoglycoside phosphotransferase family protein [Escherichia coli]|uniref:aminoglycoside phosphotransferase family protein n=1 Tax=Escherichia coli TaxID=562 RepID=UPI0035B2C98C